MMDAVILTRFWPTRYVCDRCESINRVMADHNGRFCSECHPIRAYHTLRRPQVESSLGR